MFSTLNMKWMSSPWAAAKQWKTTKVVYHPMLTQYANNPKMNRESGEREGIFGRAQLLSIAFSSLFTHNTERTQSGRMGEICSFAVWAVFKNRLKQKCFLLLNNKYKMPSHPLIQFSITAAAIAAVAVATPYEINTMSKESHNSSDATNGSQMCECTCVFVYVCIYATHQGADVCDDGQMLFASRSH